MKILAVSFKVWKPLWDSHISSFLPHNRSARIPAFTSPQKASNSETLTILSLQPDWDVRQL